VRMSVNIEPVRTGLARSVDYKYGSGMDLFAPGPTTHSMTQVDYKVMLAMCKRIISTSPVMLVQIIMQKKLALFVPLHVNNKSHNEMQFVCLFLN
jgi:hypothetical protein